MSSFARLPLTRLVRMLVLPALAWSFPASATAQQPPSMSELLTILVTNRSVATDDFVRDEAAAIATRNTFAGFIALELATVPIASSAGGFAYRLDPTLGSVTRSSDSFGPFFTERSLTLGRRHVSFGLNYRRVSFDNIGGRSLRDGTLVSTASSLVGEPRPFDVETVALRISLASVTAVSTVGVTDRLDIGFAVPISHIRIEGQRVDTYRGRSFVQASGEGSAMGLGDTAVRAKFTVLNQGASGVTLGADLRLPTGDKNNLLGAGKLSFTPRVLLSWEDERVGVHGDAGYTVRGFAEGLRYSGAVTYVATPRVTLVGEAIGSQLRGLFQLADTTTPHPRIPNVSTVRLTGIERSANRLLIAGGVKWSIGSSWLLTGNIVRPLTDVGLNARWVPTVMLDYAFRR